MIFLFRSGTLREKFNLIYRATRTHAQNLAKYATIYKATMLALKYSGSNRGKEGKWDTFFAGLLGGYIVFGRRSKKGHVSSISKQIVIFSTSLYSFLRKMQANIDGQCSICTSMPLTSTACCFTIYRNHPQPEAFRSNITWRMAGICSFKLG